MASVRVHRFPQIEIEGERYGDGGSFQPPCSGYQRARPRQERGLSGAILELQVVLPTQHGEVMTRQKEIQIRAYPCQLDRFRHYQKIRNALSNLSQAPRRAKGRTGVSPAETQSRYKVYNLAAADLPVKHSERRFEDYEFSRQSMEDHGAASRTRCGRCVIGGMRPGPSRAGLPLFPPALPLPDCPAGAQMRRE